jgi:hypothetical protein
MSSNTGAACAAHHLGADASRTKVRRKGREERKEIRKHTAGAANRSPRSIGRFET